MSNCSIIIPHYNGKEILFRCLDSIYKSTHTTPEILIVDNGSTDDSIKEVAIKFPDINIIKSEINLGYAGGCNLGARESTNEYLIFLNNDTVVTEGWLEILLNKLHDENVSSVQPKIKNLINKDYFDHAGASGGFLDIFCYPFCRGRMFDTVEKDTMQYESEKEVFWASGTAFATKKNVFIKSGMFDIKLFAHMEEIDYHWRCQMMGYKIMVCPTSTVYHEGGKTLSYESPKKTYLNHRNSLIIFLANHKLNIVLLLLFPRFVLQIFSILFDIVSLRLHHGLAQIASLLWIILNIPYLINKRSENKLIQVLNYKLNGMYRGSIVFNYFLLNKKKI